jgi:hypothetical protein
VLPVTTTKCCSHFVCVVEWRTFNVACSRYIMQIFVLIIVVRDKYKNDSGCPTSNRANFCRSGLWRNDTETVNCMLKFVHGQG